MMHTVSIAVLGMLSLASAPAFGSAADAREQAFISLNACALAAPAPSNGFAGFPEFPSVSPDGQVVVFSWAGDLWLTPVQGGPAVRLTTHPADERRSAFSPDGQWLAFESDRDGARNIYVMSLIKDKGVYSPGAIRRLTASDRPQALSGFSNDGKAVLLASYHEPEIYRQPRMYSVAFDPKIDTSASPSGVVGGPVMPLTQAHGSGARQLADGKSLLFARGSCPLERPKYRGTGNWAIWTLNPKGEFAKISLGEGNNFDAYPAVNNSIVFVSSRSGQNNLYRMPVTGESAGAATALTAYAPTDADITIGHGVRDLSVSRDGKTAVFAVWDTLYSLDLASPDATPKAIPLSGGGDGAALDLQRVIADKEVSEAVLSPDGKTLAVIARGEVFVRPAVEGYPTRRVTNSVGRERDLVWSPDGRVLYFSSDDPALTEQGASAENGEVLASNLGKYAIYGATVSLAREDLSPKKEPKAEPEKPEAPKDGKKADPGADPKADPKIDADAAKKDEQAKDEPKADDAKKDESASATPKTPRVKRPDFGKRWQESLRFSVERVASGPTDARRPAPSPDGRTLVFTRGLGDLVLLNLETGAERELVRNWDDADVEWAPDSKHLIYAVQDLDFNADIWIMNTGGAESFSGSFKQAEPVNLTRHPDNDGSPRLSADGKVLTFLSQRGEANDQSDVYQMYLDKELEGMTPYEREDYYKKAAEAAGKRKPIDTPAFALKMQKFDAGEPKADDKPAADANADALKADGEAPKPARRAAPKPEPLKLDVDDAYLRIRRLTSSPGNKNNLAVAPGGERIIYTGQVDGEAALLSSDYKGGDRKTLQAGNVSDVSISLTGDRVVFTRQGGAFTTPKAGGKVDAWPVDAPMVVDTRLQQRQKFLEAARTFGDRFYHPTLKNLDWNGLTKRYLELAENTRTSESFNRVCQLLFGEVNGSHTGASGGPGYTPPSAPVGFLGIRTKPVKGGYEVTSVTTGSPAAHKSSRLNVGDVILSVDGRAYAADANAMPNVDFDVLLIGKPGRECLLEVRRAVVAAQQKNAPKDDAPAESEAKAETDGKGNEEAKGSGGVAAPVQSPYVVITPIGQNAWTMLRYQEEVLERRALVDKLSNGRLGYLHIRGMGEAEVREFERDLYAAAHGKEGLIIDVRDNGGGSTADILLSSLTAPNHAWTAPRGVDLATVPRDAYPRDRRLIYAYTRPINVLINQHSFSNAEIFAHAIKTTKRGPLIGTRTFGGVISTGGFSLIDGTAIRMPFRGWYFADGTDMENNGAVPDVNVEQLPKDEAAGRDTQLEAAVTELLGRVAAPPRP
jgi:tricorn protease